MVMRPENCVRDATKEEDMKRKQRLRAQWAGTVVVGSVLIFAACLVGCESVSDDPASCDAIIPANALPPDWRMMASSEMPPIDKTPWWQENPQLLKGKQTEVLEWHDRPTTATKAWAVIYANSGYDRVVIFSCTYSKSGEAHKDYAGWQKSPPTGGAMVGFSRKEKNTIIFMNVEEACPDRAFFVNHFNTVAVPGPS